MKWKWYFLRKILVTYAFLLGCIFCVYVLIDLSIHGVRFLGRDHISPVDLALHYLRYFLMHLDLFSPLSFLLATLHVLFDSNSHLELIALQTAGISAKRLLLPFAWLALTLSLVGYANSEWLIPTFPLHRKHHAYAEEKQLRNITLDDDSELVYQQFDSEKKELFDVFWIRSAKDIWHMKTLSIATWPPVGGCSDHFQRQSQLEKTESFQQRVFSELPLKRETLSSVFTPFERRSISTLLQESGGAPHLHYKLALPLLPLFVLWVVAPFAMRFSRKLPTFLILAASLFGFIAVRTVFESLLIVSEGRGMVPAYAMWGPLVALWIIYWKKFATL